MTGIRRLLIAGAAGALFGVIFSLPFIGRIVRAAAPISVIAAFQAVHWREEVRYAMPAILLWVAFSFYWSFAAGNKAADKDSEKKASSIFHQVVANIALLVLMFPIPGLTVRLWPATPALRVIGFAVQSAFMALAVWSRVHLGRNWSAAVRIAEGHQLVRSGPYRRLRHPIYTAVLGMYVGTLLAIGEWHCVVALVVITLAYVRKSRLEEQILRRTFGTEYETYRREAWSLVPPLH